jgi:hypothetical protein
LGTVTSYLLQMKDRKELENIQKNLNINVTRYSY